MPLEYRLPEPVRKVVLRRSGEGVGWPGFFASGLKVSSDFMAEREQLPVQERTF